MNNVEYVKKLKELKKFIEQITEEFLKNNKPYIIPKGYEYLREVITLYAKQTNLVESTILLLENNMNEEAMVLLRSIVNNYFLILYLLNDKQEERLKKYLAQPLANDKYFLNKCKSIIQQDWYNNFAKKYNKKIHDQNEICTKIKEINKQLRKIGLPENFKPLKIIDLAKHGDEQSLNIYYAIYTNASKYEHSDVTSLDIYKDSIEKSDENLKFIISLDRTNEELKKDIMGNLILIYCDTFNKIIKHMYEKKIRLEDNYDLHILENLIEKVTNMVPQNK